MKVTFSKESVLSVIQKLQGGVPTNPPMPILSGVLVEAFGNQVSFTVSDLNIGIQGTVHANIEEEGSLLLPAKQFFALCKEFTSPEFTLSSAPSYLTHIKAGGSQFRLVGSDPEGFPRISFDNLPTLFSCPSSFLKEMLIKTAFAADRDEERPIFNSLLLQKQGAVTTITGTDGKRLARTSSLSSSLETWEGRLVLPLKTVQEMIQILDNKEDPATISLDKEKLFLQAGSFTLQSRLLVGDYPDVSRIIPEKQERLLFYIATSSLLYSDRFPYLQQQRPPAFVLHFHPVNCNFLLQMQNLAREKSVCRQTFKENFSI